MWTMLRCKTPIEMIDPIVCGDNLMLGLHKYAPPRTSLSGIRVNYHSNQSNYQIIIIKNNCPNELKTI